MKLKPLFTAKTYLDISAGPIRQATASHFIVQMLLYAALVWAPVPVIAAESYLEFGNPWQDLKRWREQPSPYSSLWFGMDLFDGKAFYEDYMVGQWVDLGYG